MSKVTWRFQLAEDESVDDEYVCDTNVSIQCSESQYIVADQLEDGTFMVYISRPFGSLAKAKAFAETLIRRKKE